MPRIIASVINDLETDQRVHKVCTSLLSMGFDILLVGRITSASGPLSRNYEIKRMRLLFSKGPFFYVEYNLRLFFKLLFSKVDILLSNDLDTLLANYLVSKIRRKPLVYDTHEYFTEVPELEGRIAKKIWQKIEAWILPNLKNVMTVNDSIAGIYANKYHINVETVRNFPYEREIEPNSTREYLLYQGAINQGRGLEQLILAMQEIEWPLKIVGNGDIFYKIKAMIQDYGLENKVELLKRVSPVELRKITAQSIAGFNLLEETSLNYKYSLANKFFDYIQSEVPVITMNFPEYQRIFQEYNVGELLNDLSPESISNAVVKLMNPREYENKKEELRKAKKVFIWENEEPKLKRIFAQF